MSRKKTIVPMAIILAKDIPSRFETAYASTLFETLTLNEALRTEEKSTPAIFYFSHIISQLKIGTNQTKFFVIYNPNKQRLQMAKFGDADKLIVKVSSVAELKVLRQTFTAVQKVAEARRFFEMYKLKEMQATNSRLLTSRIANKGLMKAFKLDSAKVQASIDLMFEELKQNFLGEFGFK